MVTGYYRLIERPDSAAVSAQAILAPHRKRTRQRIQGQCTALLIQGRVRTQPGDAPGL